MRNRQIFQFLMGPLVVLVTATLVANVAASDGGDMEIVKIEETWRLDVSQPNTERNAPQVTMVMSPYSHLESDYFVFTVNHRNHPSYHAGGSQVVRFNDETMETYGTGPKESTLETDGEAIQWTQVMSIASGDVTFEITSGTSQTWADFGGAGYLRSSVLTSQSNLNAYNPNISITESEIGFAGNRVNSLTLLKIKWYLSDGRIYERNAPIDIHTDLDPWNDED